MSIVEKDGKSEPVVLLRNLPSVEKLLRSEPLQAFARAENLPHELLVEFSRQTLDEVRGQIRRGEVIGPDSVSVETLAEQVIARAGQTLEGSLREVINATGVILHTNLGRAPLSQEATAAVARVSQAYNNLEYDLDSGERA